MQTALTVAGWLGFAVAMAAVIWSRQALTDRSQAVARACHELRSPLAAASLGLHREGRAATVPPARLRAIELELARAAAALDDLQGVHHRDADPVDAKAWLEDSVEAWRPAAAARGREVRLDWRGPPALVLGERSRLTQVTGNLISNALEHGSGVVRVMGTADAAAVRVEISDEGPGLPMPLAELLARSPRGRHGHGLRIASEAAESHGGRLTAGPGAPLVVELPRAGE